MRLLVIGALLTAAGGVCASPLPDVVDRASFSKALSTVLRARGITLPRADDCSNPSFNCEIAAHPGAKLYIEANRDNNLSRARVVFEGPQAAEIALEICSAAAEVWPAGRPAAKRSFDRPLREAVRLGNWSGNIAGRKASAFYDDRISLGWCAFGG